MQTILNLLFFVCSHLILAFKTNMSSINIVFCLFFSVFSLAIGRRVTSSSSWPEKETEWNSAPLREFWWTPRGWCPVSRIRLVWLQFYNLYVFACVFCFCFSVCVFFVEGIFLMVNNDWCRHARLDFCWWICACLFFVFLLLCVVCVLYVLFCVCVCVYVYLYVCMCTCMCVCVSVCVYVYVYVCMCKCMYMCVYV